MAMLILPLKKENLGKVVVYLVLSYKLINV